MTRLAVAVGFCLALAAPLSGLVPSASAATPCRDAKGKFVSCPTVAAKQKCRDAKGKFTACTATNAAAAPH